jgi:hypothetical protein
MAASSSGLTGPKHSERGSKRPSQRALKRAGGEPSAGLDELADGARRIAAACPGAPSCSRRAARRRRKALLRGPGRCGVRRAGRPGDALGVGRGRRADVPWSPTYDLRFAVELDGLAVLYALPATEIDFAVLGYSSRYLPLHWSTGEGPNLTARASIFHTAFYGVHGGARGGTRPHPGFRVPRPHGHRFVLFDRLRLPQGGFQGLCAHGPARHQGDGGISATRGSNPLRRLRNLLHPRRCPTVGTYGMVRFPQTPTPGCTRPARRWSWA